MATSVESNEYPVGPESTLPYPPLHTNTKFIVLCDWDGTITTLDSNDYLTDNYGFGYPRRRELNVETLSGLTTFRDSFQLMLESVSPKLSFEECKEILKQNIQIDPGFKPFVKWCQAHSIPIVIVSSGMEPLLRAVLTHLLGDEDARSIDIIANSVTFDADGRWHIQYRHPSSGYGHDKSLAILPYRNLPNPPTIFFFGDGVSDMSAAIHADVLFVKNDKPKGQNDLAAYCDARGIKRILFKTFNEALPIAEDIVQGRKTVAEALEQNNA